MRFGWLVAGAAMVASNANGQGKLVHVDTDGDGPNYDYGEPISPTMATLIRTGRVRRATAAETARLQPALRASRTALTAGLPTFVLLKPVSNEVLVRFGGSYAVNLIVPGPLRRRGLELGAGSSIFSPDGRCLGGLACGPIALAPPAPPPHPARR